MKKIKSIFIAFLTIVTLAFLFQKWQRHFPSPDENVKSVEFSLGSKVLPKTIRALDCDHWKDFGLSGCTEHIVCYFEIDPNEFEVVIKELGFVTRSQYAIEIGAARPSLAVLSNKYTNSRIPTAPQMFIVDEDWLKIRSGGSTTISTNKQRSKLIAVTDVECNH